MVADRFSQVSMVCVQYVPRGLSLSGFGDRRAARRWFGGGRCIVAQAQKTGRSQRHAPRVSVTAWQDLP